MVDCFINDSSLSAIADAIRRQVENPDLKLYPSQMAGAIKANLGNEKEFIARTMTVVNDSNVTSVAPYAFYGHDNLKIASMSACSKIGEYAFADCTSLLQADFPNCSLIESNAYNGCINLSDTIFPTCTDVAIDAFTGCTNLDTVDFQACQSITVSVFASCPNITHMTLGFSEITSGNIPLTVAAKKKMLRFSFPN